MSDAPRWKRRLTKGAILIGFAGGLALLGAGWSAYGDNKCLRVPMMNHCSEAIWVMVIGAALAIGATAALWVRAVRRGRV